MGKLGEAAIPGTLRAASFAAGFTLVLHMLVTMVSAVPPVLAPVAAGVFGIHPSRVGMLTALMFIVSIPAGLTCTKLIARFGALRCCQIIAASTALALLLMALAGMGARSAAGSGLHLEALFVALLLVAAVILGPALGLINPISSLILFHASPVQLRSFFFSIKQTAVPAGYAIAGLLVPALLLLMPWQESLLILAATVAGFAVLMFGMHVQVAPPAAGAARHRGLRGFFEPVHAVWKSRPLREMGFVSMLYSMNQMAMSVFLVSYLNLELGMSLIAAGAMFAGAQFAGMVGRIVWGLSADLWVAPRLQIGMLGIAGGLCGVTVSMFSPAWSHGLMLGVCMLFGFTAVAWNGIYLAEVARLSGNRDIGAMTAGVGVFNSIGALGGPALFSLLVSISGVYALGYLVFAFAPLLLGLRLVLTPSHEKND